MTRNIILALIFLVSIKLYGQTPDTCQCRLMYGNVLHPTLVVYHHDTIVSYRNSITPKDTVYKLLKINAPIEKILQPEYFNWHKFTSDYSYQDKSIGRILNNQYYPEYFFDTISLGREYNTYYLRYDKAFKDTILHRKELEIQSYQKINGQVCNCYNTDNFVFIGNYKELQLNAESLNKIPSVEGYGFTDTTNVFLWDDGCRMGISKFCYLKGIGFASVDYPYPDNYIIKVNYLDTNCRNFLRKKLRLNLTDD